MWTKQRGFASISELIRTTLGFQLGLPGTETITEADELDNFASLAKLLVGCIDRIDEMKRDINLIKAHLGANRKGELAGGVSEVKPNKAEQTRQVATSQLPDGFSR